MASLLLLRCQYCCDDGGGETAASWLLSSCNHNRNPTRRAPSLVGGTPTTSGAAGPLLPVLLSRSADQLPMCSFQSISWINNGCRLLWRKVGRQETETRKMEMLTGMEIRTRCGSNWSRNGEQSVSLLKLDTQMEPAEAPDR
jgi:hypothetical protein